MKPCLQPDFLSITGGARAARCDSRHITLNHATHDHRRVGIEAWVKQHTIRLVGLIIWQNDATLELRLRGFELRSRYPTALKTTFRTTIPTRKTNTIPVAFCRRTVCHGLLVREKIRKIHCMVTLYLQHTAIRPPSCASSPSHRRLK